ncbi:Hypothetical protein A7982_01687 [Minicystis rosea]|nr:Hypothetical protein A7982_01687 [Minicystis rosea]
MESMAKMPAPSAAASAVAEGKGSGAKKAEVKTWKRARLPSNAARLAVGDHETLPLVGVDAHVRIDGFRARVVLDYYFENQSSRGYEGTFQLRLPNDASPYFFAFGPMVKVAKGPPELFAAGRKLEVEPAGLMADRAETWTQPKEARMVPKARAAVAYEQTVRQRVDPALVEWAGAGVFNARVFPLEAGKVHRVVLGYDVDLVRAGDDLEYAFDVPENVPTIAVDLGVLAPAGAGVTVNGDDATGRPLLGTADEGGGRKGYRFAQPKGGTITVRMKGAARPIVLAGEDTHTGPYFAVEMRADLPADKAAQSADRGVILVDTSLSSNPDKYNVWLSLMEALLTNNRDTMKRFAVLFFDVEARWYKPAFIDNTPENVAELMAHAKTLALEGATDLGGALAQAARPKWAATPGAPWDVFLLSDGAATWGESDPYAISRALSGGNAAALYAYQTGLSGTETGLLTHLARESSGAVFSVVGEAEIPAASRAHRARPLTLEGIEVPGATDILVAGRPRALFPGQRLFVTGRGTPEKGVSLAITVSDRGNRRTLQQKLDVPLPSRLAPRIYGQIAVAGLEELGPPTEDLAASYAVHFRVTGRTTSLLMLESEDAYRRAGVKAPDPEPVKNSPAAAAIAAAIKAIGDALGDPKAGFFAFLDRLGRAPGMTFQAPAAVREALSTLPPATFTVEAPPLETRIAAAQDLPGSFRELLSIRQIEYEAFTAEAERRRKAAGPADALKALSSLVEESPGDAVLARDVAFTAMSYGLGGHAYHLFRRVAAARPHEPQTYRAIAACLVEMKRVDLAMAYYEVGLAGQWDARFGDFRRILALEYLHTLRRIASGELTTTLKGFADARLAELSSTWGPKQADVVVMITWNTDHTDVDLHVVEPSDEECYYAHRKTKQGGEITQDVTQGYGPEMYVLPKAASGEYKIRAHYFASDRNRQSARTKVQALVFQGWGTKEERVTDKVVTLELNKAKHDIATITVP